ncbi:MAG: hypothetical protein M0D55_08475 [Elusimicrobiota bacterium]|nr:MAG: hypothetical protein M0D55_08475 [Elusimicrobiota bacterium]
MPDRARLTRGGAAAALVAAQAAWFAAGFVFPALPGWTMFAKVEPARARLVDATGLAVEVYDLIPKDVYLVDRAGARAIASWQCRTRPEGAPWKLVWPDDVAEDACAR